MHDVIKSYSTLLVKYDSTNPVISLSCPMAERKKRPTEDTVYIDERDRQDILARMKLKGINKAQLATECDVTKGAITLLLSKPIPKGETRGCRFASKLQAALGLALTPKRPTIISSEQQRRVDRIVKKLQGDPEELEHWLANGEHAAGRAK